MYNVISFQSIFNLLLSNIIPKLEAKDELSEAFYNTTGSSRVKQNNFRTKM